MIKDIIIMRKLVLSCLLMFLTLGMSAQSLVGSWQQESSNSNGRGTYSYSFDKRGGMAIIIDIEQVKNGMTISLSFVMPGTYKRAGQVLSMNFIREAATVSVNNIHGGLYDKLSPEDKAKAKAAMALQTDSYRQIIVSSLPETVTQKIKSITANQLVLVIEGKEQKYKRVASR